MKDHHTYPLLFLLLFASCDFQPAIEQTSYLARPHFKIVTENATYLYDMMGGGFSSIKDKEGIEWVGFKTSEDKFPAGAATCFRGLPNMVYQGEDGGTGHPGFEQCITKVTSKNQIQTESKSGKWKWKWTFTDNGAYLNILETDTTRQYWFLYEGTPGGKFDPKNQYWGNNIDGLKTDTPYLQDSVANGRWDWAYFGHNEVNRSLVVAQLTSDTLVDNFSYLGNTSKGINAEDGMVVFGFGRTGARQLLKGNNRFFIGFSECDPANQTCFDQWLKRIRKDTF